MRRFLILNTAAEHAALELAIRESRGWHGKEQATGTTRYCGEPRKDANGKYPFPVLDQRAEAFVRKYKDGKYAKRVLKASVQWPKEPEE